VRIPSTFRPSLFHAIRLASVRLIGTFVVASALATPATAAPQTSTLAGGGQRGIVDGASTTASFMAPSAVAVAPDDSVVVADAAAQNIRRIARGRVTTLAGISAEGTTPDERTGGYLDGPATLARFDRPVGVAIARNGDVYVADAGNRCVRRISHGFVSTLSGSRAPGHADGEARIAQFDDIRSIAIDDDGLLYVADYGNGIRRIDTYGTVSTVSRPSDAKTILAVAVRGSGAHAILAWADANRVHVTANGRTQDVAYVDIREPGLPELSVGNVTALAIANENTLVVADAATSAVRVLRLPAPPFLTDRMSRALAGGVREGSDIGGGFADGPPELALVRAPRGIALARDGTIVVADTGNRRVRAIRGVDARESILPDAPYVRLAHGAYRIVVVGNSYAFYNVLWPESIPGRIEARLERDASAIGLRTRVGVAAYRVDDLSAPAALSLAHEYLADGQADLVILMLNAFGPWSADQLHALSTELDARGTKLILAYTPQAAEVSPIEAPSATLDRTTDFNARHAEAVRSESFYTRSGIETVLMLDQMEAWEGRPEREPLFYGADHHFTIFGSQWVGERIAEALERSRPWLTSRR
jgi:hypothetical protein